MKIFLLLILAASAHASPYLRTPFTGGPTVHYEGVIIDPTAPGKTAAIFEVALITHDPKDGCLFPSIICEEWAPLANGLGINGGRVLWDLGPTVNVFPWMLTGLAKVGYSPSFWPAGSPVAFAFGPKLGLNPIDQGKFQPINKWDARLLLMTALEVRF